MSASGTETLTAALRRLADEHATGLLSVATPGRDVVLELAEGVPVGIGPTANVSARIGRDAGASLMAAAVVDDLVNRTVAAIVGGGGQWTWDVASHADMMPVPEGLAAEISRRAVDAAQALSTIEPETVLRPGRSVEAAGEVGTVLTLFDGARTLEEVAEAAGMTVPATATIAAALLDGGALRADEVAEDEPSWTATVAGDEDEDDDEPELWVMDDPGDDEDTPEPEAQQPEEASRPAAPARPGTPVQLRRDDVARSTPERAPGTPDEPVADDDAASDDHEVPAAVDWAAGDEPEPAPATSSDDDGWDDTTWLDELDSAPVSTRGGASDTDERAGATSADARSSLSAMLSDLQSSTDDEVEERELPPVASPRDDSGPTEGGDEDEARDATRKEPKAQPGEVAEFLRELSRLALDDE